MVGRGYYTRVVSLTPLSLRQDTSRHWVLAVDKNKRAIKDMGPIIEYLVTVIDGSSLMSESGSKKAFGGRRSTQDLPRRTTRNDDDEPEEGEDGEEGEDEKDEECETRDNQVVEQLQKIVRYEHGTRKTIIEEKLHIVALTDNGRLFLSDLLPGQSFTSRSTLIAALSLTVEGQQTLEAVLESLGDEADEVLASGGSAERGREKRPRERKRKDAGSQDNNDNAPPKRGRTRGDGPAQKNVSEAAEVLVGLGGSGSMHVNPVVVGVENIKHENIRLKGKIERLEAEIEKKKSEFEKARTELENELEEARSEHKTLIQIVQSALD